MRGADAIFFRSNTILATPHTQPTSPSFSLLSLSLVLLLLPEGVNRRVHVSGIMSAAVGVQVTQGKEVNIVEDETVNMVKLECLHKANVEQLSSVERCGGGLFNNYNPGERK